MHQYKNIFTGEITTSAIEFQNLKHGIVQLDSTGREIKDKKIIVVRRALGDTLMLFPALELWYKDRGRPQITFATDDWLIPLANRQPFIDSAIDYSLVDKQSVNDELYWLEGLIDHLADKREHKHRTIMFADQLYTMWGKMYDGLEFYKYRQEDLKCYDYFRISEQDIKIAKQLLVNAGWDGKRKLVALSPYTKSRFREWQGENTLMRTMPDYDFVVLHHKRTELGELHHNSINLTGHTTVIAMAAILSVCSAAVLPDSGVMHVAGVVGIPTIAIFGRVIPPANRIWLYENVKPIESSCPIKDDYCYDTQFHSCVGTSNFRGCMNLITVDDISNQLSKILED